MVILKELIKKYPRSIYFNTEITNINIAVEKSNKCSINIEASPEQKWNFNSKVKLVCVWYSGSLPDGVRERVNAAFKEKNFEEFIKIEKSVRSNAPNSYWGLPDDVYIYYKDIIIGHINYIDEFLFKNIDHQECEYE